MKKIVFFVLLFILNVSSYSQSKEDYDKLTEFLTFVNIEEIFEKYSNVLLIIDEYLGTPYKYGGTTKSGIDCSAFVKNVYFESLGIKLPRISRDQEKIGVEVSKENLNFIDLIFFDIKNKGKVSHVGLYISNGVFVHSGTKKGVSLEKLDSEYYSKKFFIAKRIVGS
jgi:lipoprotein Spr